MTFVTYQRWTLPESVRSLVIAHCLHDQGKKAQIHALVVMPDHVHMLLSPLVDCEAFPYTLSEILQGIKGSSAHSINKSLGRKGRVWQDESYDHALRLEEDTLTAAEYILQNPVRKGLASTPDEYPWVWREWEDGTLNM